MSNSETGRTVRKRRRWSRCSPSPAAANTRGMTGFVLLLALAAPIASPPAHAGAAAAAAPEALMHADDEAVRRGFTRTRKTIPLAFQGSFRRTAAECVQESDTALVIGPTSIRIAGKEGAGKEGDVQEVRVEGPRKILVTSIYEGGGEVCGRRRRLCSSDAKVAASPSSSTSAVTRGCAARRVDWFSLSG